MCSGALLPHLWSKSSCLSPPRAALSGLSAAPVVLRLGRFARPARPAGASNTARRPVCAAGRRPCRRPRSAHARSDKPAEVRPLCATACPGPRPGTLPESALAHHGLAAVGSIVGLGGVNASWLSSSPPTILITPAQIIPQKCSPRTPRPLLLLRGPLDPSTQQLSPCKSCLFPRQVAFKKCALRLLCSSARRPQSCKVVSACSASGVVLVVVRLKEEMQRAAVLTGK